MTATSDKIEDRLSYGLTDWRISAVDQSAVVAYLHTDTALDATLRDLGSSGLATMFTRMGRTQLLRNAIQIIAGRSPSHATLVRSTLTQAARPFMSRARNPLARPAKWYGGPAEDYFDLCYDLGFVDRAIGLGGGGGGAVSRSHTGASHSSAFSGVGATGVNPTSLSVGAADSVLMAGGHDSTIKKYSNPLGDLGAYIRGLTPTQRLGQAKQLVNQRISTILPYVYVKGAPTRAKAIGKAAALHKLEPELVAAFILAEQRDQSRLEDAKDYEAAMSMFRKNTSIGLGQVVVSTAKRHDLFRDLVRSSLSKRLSHKQIASLLASDEYNIYATTKYIRLMANRASGLSLASLPNTKAAFPALNLAAFARPSRHWPRDNVTAMASEYTSRPWDDRLSTGWAWFVGQAYDTFKSSGIAFR